VKRLLPTSLGGQLILLLLAALVVSHVLGFLIFTDERRQAMRSVHHLELLERTAAMVRVLEATSPSGRQEILRAVGSPRLRYWITAETALNEANSENLEQQLALALQEMLGMAPRPLVRAHMTDDGWPRDMMAFHERAHREREWRKDGEDRLERDDDDDDDHGFGPDRHWRPGGGMGLALSVSLSDGQWLNVATGFRLPRSDWAWPSVVSMSLAALAILLIVILTVRRITRPLKALSSAAERLGRGEDVEPLVQTGPAEVQRTTAAFNAMRERLTRFVRDRTVMLAAISHDLRTPLTSLRLHAELVEEGETRTKLLAILEEGHPRGNAAHDRGDAGLRPRGSGPRGDAVRRSVGAGRQPLRRPSRTWHGGKLRRGGAGADVLPAGRPQARLAQSDRKRRRLRPSRARRAGRDARWFCYSRR
jgi:signal transduction histidine kinase